MDLLKGAPRELWVILVVNVGEAFAYFLSALNMTIFLTDTFGFSDLEAGLVYSGWGFAAGITGFFVGPLIDSLRVRPSLLLGCALLGVARIFLTFATSKTQLFASLFVLHPLGMNLLGPALNVALRRVTTTETRSPAFGLLYSCTNLSAMAAGVVTDGLRHHRAISMRSLFFITPVVTVLYATLLFWGISAESSPPDVSGGGIASKWGEIRATGRDPVFRRMIVLGAAVLGARSIFRHMDTTLPKWAERQIGPGAHYGILYAVNPAIIIVAVPFVQTRMSHVDPYVSLLAGTALTGIAPFILAVLPPSYPAALLFVIVFSLGEAVYSPRLAEYAVVLAPPGKEGTYSTLAAAPSFFVKVAVGTLGGELLGLYCPPEGSDCRFMWFLIGAIAATTPIILYAIRPWLYSDEVKRRLVAV